MTNTYDKLSPLKMYKLIDRQTTTVWHTGNKQIEKLIKMINLKLSNFFDKNINFTYNILYTQIKQ